MQPSAVSANATLERNRQHNSVRFRTEFIQIIFRTQMPSNKIVSLKRFTDGLQVNRANAKPVVMRTGSAVAAMVLERIMNGETRQATTSLPVAESS